MKPGAFPLFVRPEAGRALVIGSGRIAAHKAAMLHDAGFEVETCRAEDFAGKNPGVFALVVAATADREFNRRVSAACREKRTLVNVVDDPSLCTVYFGAMEKRGPVTVAVSTDGTCPVAGQVLRDRIRPLLTDDFVATVERLGAEREDWKARCPEPSERAQAMRKEFEK